MELIRLVPCLRIEMQDPNTKDVKAPAAFARGQNKAITKTADMGPTTWEVAVCVTRYTPAPSRLSHQIRQKCVTIVGRLDDGQPEKRKDSEYHGGHPSDED